MPEDPLTPDPLLARLARLTPTAVDRDELLFRAGRASVRTPRRWQWACGVLALTQAVGLGLWATRPPERVVVFVAPAPPAVAPEPVAEPGPSPEPDPTSYLALTRVVLADGHLPAAHGGAADPHRPAARLTAGSRPTVLD